MYKHNVPDKMRQAGPCALFSVFFVCLLCLLGFHPELVHIKQTNKQTNTNRLCHLRWGKVAAIYKKKDASVASTNFFASPAAFRSDHNSNKEVGAQSFVQNFYHIYVAEET